MNFTERIRSSPLFLSHQEEVDFMADAHQGGGELLTLSEVSNRTNISMPTLQRYKKLYQDRLPTVGKGRKQRYPVEALEVFEQIKQENIGRRGRPRKKGKGKTAAPGRKKASERKGGAKRGRGKAAKSKPAAAQATEGLLTLTEIGERTGISYPTLVRYVKHHLDRIPHEGKGRRRRFYPEAVEVFQQIRSESPRGRRKKSGTGAGKAAAGRRRASSAGGDAALSRRVQALEKSQDRLEKQIKALIQNLKKPMTVTIQRK
jgi:DNA-binding transcriptional MerR regulator